jgi:hypothetical protein
MSNQNLENIEILEPYETEESSDDKTSGRKEFQTYRYSNLLNLESKLRLLLGKETHMDFMIMNANRKIKCCLLLP